MSESTFYHMISFVQRIDGYVGSGSNRIEKPKGLPPGIEAIQLSLDI
jgi:hypothetical protein